MKTLILSTSFAVMIALAPDAAAQGFYVGAYGGPQWDDVIDHPSVSNDTGMVIGGVVGTGVKSVPGLRIEADISFRQNETTVDFCGPCSGISIDHDTWALMANAAYDVDLGQFKPYVLLGAGYANSQATVENIALARVESAGFAWQLGAGVNTTVADGVTVGLGYRYLQAPDITVLGMELSSGANHAVLAEVKFALE